MARVYLSTRRSSDDGSKALLQCVISCSSCITGIQYLASVRVWYSHSVYSMIIRLQYNEAIYIVLHHFLFWQFCMVVKVIFLGFFLFDIKKKTACEALTWAAGFICSGTWTYNSTRADSCELSCKFKFSCCWITARSQCMVCAEIQVQPSFFHSEDVIFEKAIWQQIWIEAEYFIQYKHASIW